MKYPEIYEIKNELALTNKRQKLLSLCPWKIKLKNTTKFKVVSLLETDGMMKQLMMSLSSCDQ